MGDTLMGDDSRKAGGNSSNPRGQRCYGAMSGVRVYGTCCATTICRL